MSASNLKNIYEISMKKFNHDRYKNEPVDIIDYENQDEDEESNINDNNDNDVNDTSKMNYDHDIKYDDNHTNINDVVRDPPRGPPRNIQYEETLRKPFIVVLWKGITLTIPFNTLTLNPYPNPQPIP
jgi:hypothetical protein